MRGIIVILLWAFCLPSFAFKWQDLWSTRNQQAQRMMNKGQYQAAKETFTNEAWRAAATYRSGDYAQAARLYGQLNGAEAAYNQGNALAHLGQYEQAIASYDKSIKINPNLEDARKNRKLLEDLLKEDKEKKQSQPDQQQPSSSSQKQDKQSAQKPQDSAGQQQQNPQHTASQDQKKQPNQTQSPVDSAAADKSQAEQKKKLPDQDSSTSAEASKVDSSFGEKQQAKEQWLRLIPDDPGGLMREKFKRDHLRRRQQ